MGNWEEIRLVCGTVEEEILKLALFFPCMSAEMWYNCCGLGDMETPESGTLLVLGSGKGDVGT